MNLYNNTCSFCIFIGRELCVIKVHTHGWRQLMAWSNLANLFCGSSHGFCQLYYNIKQIDFIFLCSCTVIDHWWPQHSTTSRAYFFVLHTPWRHLWSSRDLKIDNAADLDGAVLICMNKKSFLKCGNCNNRLKLILVTCEQFCLAKRCPICYKIDFQNTSHVVAFIAVAQGTL